MKTPLRVARQSKAEPAVAPATPARPVRTAPFDVTRSLPRMSFRDVTITNQVSSATQPVLQAKWVKAGEGEYYWAGRSSTKTALPDGAIEVPAPPLQMMADEHPARRGGSMRSLRSDPDHDLAALELLAHYAMQARDQVGYYYAGPTERRSMGPVAVQSHVPDRDPNAHRAVFRAATGFSSATAYQQHIGTAREGISYEILHCTGHGQCGAQTQTICNMGSASQGANSEMCPFDEAITGNTNVEVQSYLDMRQGTDRIERVHQIFAHRDYPDEPFHHRVIDGDRPRPTRSEWDRWDEEAKGYAPDILDAGAILRSFTSKRRPRDAAPEADTIVPGHDSLEDDDEMANDR